MVGVAGKSLACHDCKRRRVKVRHNNCVTLPSLIDVTFKCDQRKPSCLRCEKARLVCQGYSKSAIFVNRTLATPSTTALTVIARPKLPSTQPHLSSYDLQQMFQLLRKSSDDVSHPSSFRSQAWDLLKDTYLPRAAVTDQKYANATSAYSWLLAVCQMIAPSEVLDQSLLAFCAIQVYIAEPLNFPMDQALQLYNEALSKLVYTLGHMQEQRRDETLGAIVVLSTCEVCTGSFKYIRN